MAKRRTEEEPPPHTDDDQRAPEQSSTGYNPFLKVADLGRGPVRLDLTGWVRRTVGRFGPQIVIEVHAPGGRTFDFGIKDGSPNHRMMFRGMGRDETKWEGAIIVEVETFTMKGGRKSNPAIAIREVISNNPPF